jgi:endoglucanase
MNWSWALRLPAALFARPRAQSRRVRRGVSLAGPEFGTDRPGFSNASPGIFGQDYTYNSEETVAYFCAQGFSLLRLPLRWERLQPRLGQALDEEELSRVKGFVGWARAHGGEVILDIHNYGRYVLGGSRPCECVIDQPAPGTAPVTRGDFVDLWRRLSGAFRDEPAVHAYGLMNEPHDMGGSDWKGISQAAVDAIRGEGDRKRILVAGDGWSSAERFAEVNGRRAWVEDGAGEVHYEAHCYFDHDNSGRYERDYGEELAADARLEQRGVDRLRPFLRWCAANRVRGLVGEFGVPGNDPRWQAVLARFLEALDRAGMEGCYWAAGEWWGAYPLSIQPGPAWPSAAPQLEALRR